MRTVVFLVSLSLIIFAGSIPFEARAISDPVRRDDLDALQAIRAYAQSPSLPRCAAMLAVSAPVSGLATQVDSVLGTVEYKSPDELNSYFSNDPYYTPEIAGLLTGAAAQYDINPAFLQCLAYAESSFKSGAVSNRGAEGMMQIEGKTRTAIEGVIGHVNWFSAKEEVPASAYYVKQTAESFFDTSDLNLSRLKVLVASYNMGVSGLIRRCGGPPIDAAACMQILSPPDAGYENPSLRDSRTVPIRYGCWQARPADIRSVAPCASLDEVDKVMQCVSPNYMIPPK